jgi:chemotaxis regulatin CheY-phosphate phosphatase CheZ
MATHEENARMVFGDSRATLREVRGLLAELGELSGDTEASSAGSHETGVGHASLGGLVTTLHRVYGEIIAIVECLRDSRSLLERASVERLHRTHAKLREVSSATEVATTGLLDSLDTALALVDRLEPAAGSSAGDANGASPPPTGADDHAATRDELREELHSMMSLLQFQDITAQQLGHAASVLEDIEGRLISVAKVFDFDLDLGESERADDGEVAGEIVTNDPNASTLGAESRQALADAIFTTPGPPPPAP